VVAAALALCASVTWGSADFLGGFFSRRLPFAGVTMLSQFGALAAAFVVALAAGGLTASGVGLGAAAGLFSAVGVLTYYRALATGTMSVVAPISACGAVITLGLALASGERPSGVKLAGAVLAFLGAVLASFHEHRRGGANRRSIALAAATAASFGVLLYLLGRASDAGGAGSALLGSRLTAVAGVAAWIALARPELGSPSPRLLAGVLTVGVVGAAATLLYSLATERGLLSIVALLAALYPVTTVVLAQLVLGERFLAVQAAGVTVALAGVGLVVAG
jgi:drug/metabolite transporter (DMT)-like permease